MRQRIARCIILTTFLSCIVGGYAADALAAGSSDWTAADHFGLPMDQPQFTRRASNSMQIARDFWGGVEPPCSGARVYAATQDQMVAATRTASTAGLTDWCSIWVPTTLVEENTWMARIQACTIIVHEYGHVIRAYGNSHSAQRGSVMYPELELNEVVYACYRRFLPRGKGREFCELVGKPLFLHR